MTQLIEDAVRVMMEIIYHSDVNPPWAELANLSLVCRAWSHHAQALLFASVRIHSLHHLRCFLEATDPNTPRGRHLGSAVRILSVTVYPVAYVTRIVSTRLPELLERCSKLYELKIVLEEMDSWAPETIEELRKRSPPIMALRLRDGMNKGIAARQLLHVWPSLRHLTIRSSSIDNFDPSREDPLQFTLFELRWENMHPPTTYFLMWLLNYDLASQKRAYLRILHLSKFPDEDHGELAARCGPHLHSLRIPNADRAFIESARNLKEVFLFNGDGFTPRFLSSLPPTVEHIAFAYLHGVDALGSIFQVKRSGEGLQKLRVVSMHIQVNHNWPSHWAKLVTVAQSLNIELIRQENRGFLVGGSEDLVVPRHYPRPSTIRQFDLMASAVDVLPTAYTDLDEVPVPPPPPSKHAEPEVAEPSSPYEGRSSMPYSRSTPQSEMSFGGRQTIRLDDSVPYPRPWDYENDRPLGPIILDDVPLGDTGKRGKLWRVARTTITKAKLKLGAKDSRIGRHL